MQEPPTRHIDTGGVHVDDLLQRSTPSSRYERLADTLLSRCRETPKCFGRGTRVTIGAVGIVLLCAATVAISTITGTRASTAREEAPEAIFVTGGSALRLDVLRSTSWPYPDNGGFAGEDGSAVTDPPPAPPTPAEESAAHHTANPAAGSPASAAYTARSFYARLGKHPPAALRMLTPRLVAGQSATLATAWEDAETVRVDQLRVHPDGKVAARARVDLPDGTRIWLRHSLTVTSDSQPKITDIRLLQARRSAPG